MTHNLERKAVFKTSSPPCCLRINPIDPSIVYFGTYTLIEGSNRTGTIEIWKLHESVDGKLDHPDDSNINVEELPIHGEKLKCINTKGAVLDIKVDFKSVNSSDDHFILATAQSLGNITFWKINKADPLDIAEISNISILDDAESLITSINFHPRKTYVSFTSTTGYVGYYDYSNPDSMPTFFECQHTLEAWYADWCHLSPLENIIFSGGDDQTLIAHDLRIPTPIFTASRIHDAGIVSILTSRDSWCNSAINPYMIWTGGYDDQLCVLDLRAGGHSDLFQGIPPLVKEKHNLGGGVWRLIPSPDVDDHRVLTCNMYDGGRILNYDNSNAQNVQISGFFKGDHSSITYGGDWVEKTAITCSFYDNIVQIWNV